MSAGTATQTAVEERLYRIGEVSRLSELKPFVLRYWETEFPMLEPVKSPSGHRMYRQEDVDMVFKIKRLLYDEGFTIAGARRHLRETNGMIGGEPAAGAGMGAGAHAGSSAGFAGHGGGPGAGHGSGGSGTAGAGAGTGMGHGENAAELLSRKMLLDLRDTLRAFLTLLERR
jgi:DNA-binding transcriptional MerR regulator